MNDIRDNRSNNINKIVATVKLASLLFCGIIICTKFFSGNNFEPNPKYKSFSILALLTFTGLMLLIYWLWSILYIKKIQYKYAKAIEIIENLIFIVIFSGLIMISGNDASQYKFLFLFIIITSTLQLGMRQGLVMAYISSAIILAMDLFMAPSENINMYFQNDLIMAGVFILTAWPLGHYVEIEQENLNKKNIQLKELSSELEKQDKQRKYVEEVLLKNKDCYNLLIENSYDAILIQRERKLIFVNESAARLLGFKKPQELNGKNILEFAPMELRAYIQDKFTYINKERSSMISFYGKVLRSNDGSIIDVENTCTYFMYDGKPAILSILRDITSQKQVQKLQKDVEENKRLLNETREYNKLITEFFSNISHELKTPLNVIFAAVQTLSLFSNDIENHKSKQEEYLKIMKQNCYRLTKLINNLLDMTRLDSGFLKLQCQNYDIVSVVENITLSVVSYVESKGISLIFDTDIEEKVVACDADKIERIILNLISNSIKFTNPGGLIQVTIIDKKDNIVISVKDTGVGIPEDKMKIIFERFGQVDKTLKRNREGTGIGLSLVKSFVEMHGGSINIKSKVGEGSEFIIKLPAVTLEKSANEEPIYESNIEKINIEFSDIYSN